MSEVEESRLVENARRELLLYRIFSGKLDYGDSYIREPNYKIKEKGKRIYYDVLKDCKDVPSDRDIFVFLLDSGQWSIEQQNKLDGLPKQVENLKIELYKNYESPRLRKEKKITLQFKKEEFAKLSLLRNKYRHMTKGGIAEGAMWFEMINYMYSGPDKLAAVNFYKSNMIGEDDIRSIALGHDFISYYGSSKNIFGRSAIKMTDDQRRLIMWGNLYKNVRSNPECPQDKIFEDHDAFDGWLILENRKNTANKKIESTKGINPNARNIYYTVKSKEEHEEIMSLNSPEALMTMQKEFKGLGGKDGK